MRLVHPHHNRLHERMVGGQLGALLAYVLQPEVAESSGGRNEDPIGRVRYVMEMPGEI